MRRLVRWATYASPIAVVLALGEIHAHFVGHYPLTGTTRFAWTVAFVVILEVTTYAFGIPDAPDSGTAAFWTSLGAVGSGAIAISLVQLAVGSSVLPRAVVLGTVLVLVPVLMLLSLLDRRARRSDGSSDRVLAVLSPDETGALEGDLVTAPERAAHLVGVLDPSESPTSWVSSLRGVPPSAPAGPGVLVQMARDAQADLVVLGRDAAGDEWLVSQAAVLHGSGLRIRGLSTFYDEWLGKLPISELERVSLMFDIQEIHAPRYARIKRLVDVVAGLVGLVALLIVIPVVAVADLFGNRGPIFFTQERVGKGGRHFVIFKFRTMAGEPTGEWTSVNDPRVPLVGRWMRRAHLDEIPQSINLLRGTISLVGPRPEQPRYVEELREKIPFYDIRHLVNPGITGWAQVKFLYGSSVEDALQKLQYEFFYMRHQGPILDMRIMARTLRSVLRLHGR